MKWNKERIAMFGINGYTQRVYDRIVKFSGIMEGGVPKNGTHEIDETALIYLLGDFERRLCEIEDRLKIKHD